MKKTTKTRFYEKIRVSADTDCLEWTAGRSGVGYGKLKVAGRDVLAHRFAYELLVGPIPDGLQLDHLCRNRGCVNPGHLEPVTARINTLRGVSGARRNAEKTHCDSGHPLAGDNLRTTPARRRVCRTCERHRKAESFARHHGGAVAAVGNAWKTHCKHGHPLSGDNLYVRPADGERVCVTCRRSSGRKYAARRRAGPPLPSGCRPGDSAGE